MIKYNLFVSNKTITQKVFKYLDKVKIRLDEEEFLLQLKSHPDYPSLLSIVDTLDFFKVKVGAFEVSAEKIDLLPVDFLAFLRDDNSRNPILHNIEKKDVHYLVDNKKVSAKKITELWDNKVLLIENNEGVNYKISNSKKTKITFLFLYSIIFLISILFSYKSIWNTFFFLLPLAGFLFSLGALKDILGSSNSFLDKFCKMASNADCTVTKSTKWKVFRYISFTDLSITFFSMQIVSYLLLNISNYEAEYFTYQKILLYTGSPVILISLYYQKFVEKKWCSICLSIILILMLELIYIINVFDAISYANLSSIIFFLIIYSSVVVSWYYLKSILLKIKELKDFKVKANRFKRDYKYFKNNLMMGEKNNVLPCSTIIGNKKSDLRLTIITDLYCKYCKNAHQIVENIFSQFNENLSLNIIFNFNIENKEENHDVKLLYRSLVLIKIKKDEAYFIQALNDWFENKDLKNWLDKYKIEDNTNNADEILRTHYNWCMNNKIYFTPALFIQGYLLPKKYDIEDVEYFIKDLIENPPLL